MLFCSFCFYRFSFLPCVQLYSLSHSISVPLHLKCYYCWWWWCCFSQSNRYTSIRETTLSLCPRYYSLALHLRDKPYAIHKQHQQKHVIDTKYHFRLNVLAVLGRVYSLVVLALMQQQQQHSTYVLVPDSVFHFWHYTYYFLPVSFALCAHSRKNIKCTPYSHIFARALSRCSVSRMHLHISALSVHTALQTFFF